MDSYDDESDYQELIQLVPRVYGKLKDGHLQEWLQFMRMTDLNCFPSSNIAYLLFLDVVKWYSLGDSKLMRYSDEVKHFWRLGQKLFHGKFITFHEQFQMPARGTRPE